MAFLDDIDKKLTNLGQGAIQKTKEVTDSAKLSSSIKNLEGQKRMRWRIWEQFVIENVGKAEKKMIRKRQE